MRAMIKTVLLVPVRDNEGRPFPRSAWRALEEQLLQFGGFSRSANVAGVWASGNRIYRDVSRQYVVALTSWTQLPAWLVTVQRVRGLFRQEALYIEVAGIPEILAGEPQPPAAASSGA